MRKLMICILLILFCLTAYNGFSATLHYYAVEVNYFDTECGIYSSSYALILTYDDEYSLKKPLFLVEGFDPNDGTSDAFTVYDLISMLEEYELKDPLLEAGYSLVLVDLTTNWNPLKSQAKAFGELVQKVWDQSLKTQPLKIAGFSMGGLVTTTMIGLREDYNPEDWDFETNLLITYDSPHSGAYVPAGIYGFSDYFKNNSDEAEQVYNAMTGTAAKQMVLMGFTSEARSVHDTWQAFYNLRLNIVKNVSGLRFVGFVNGSWNGVPQYSGSTGVQTLHWEGTFFELNLYTQGRSDKLAAVCEKWFSGDGYYYHYSTSPNLENSPGGYGDFYQTVYDGLVEEGGSGYLLRPNTTFINSFSAAALPYATYSQYTNFAALEDLNGKMENYSPLHKIYHHDGDSEEHCFVSETFKQDFLNELQWATQEPNTDTIFSIIDYLLNSD